MGLPLLALTLLAAPLASAETLTGRVVGIADGDTITGLDSTNDQHKVRLAGIDAPEKRQPFGNVAKQNLARLVARKAVSVEYVKFDRYRRLVGKVTVNGVDVQLEQLRAGLAWWYKKYERDQSPQDRVTYAAVEQEAQKARRGLWQEKEPVAPWEWRRNR
jgi:endonuclease YncB( thermonuclease family)